MSAIRPPCRAGQFYPANPAACRSMLEGLFAGLASQPAIGAVAPHAGWVYSGATAALAVASLAAFEPETVIIFGAVHTADMNTASMYPVGEWESPLGRSPVDDELARTIQQSDPVATNPAAHQREHSIEVLLPMIQVAMADVSILPIVVRPSREAGMVGRTVAEAARELGRRAAYLASTDLTHYGPAFGFAPAGGGPEGVRWAKDVNDRRFVDRLAAMDETGVIEEASSHRNACGAGAVAALIGAMHTVGAQRYVELSHTTSAEIEGPIDRASENSVGYEAGIFPAPN